jgi:hypothetical protein
MLPRNDQCGRFSPINENAPTLESGDEAHFDTGSHHMALFVIDEFI